MKGFAFFRRLHSSCSRSILYVIAIVAILLAAPFAGAQSTGGRIRGTVADPSGGAVVGATVTLINEATHATRDVQTGANGEYIFLEVPVGTYEIDATSQGFKKYTRKGIPLNLNEVIAVDLVLQVGGATDVVEVTGAPPVVDTTSTQLGAIVNSRASTQLPLNQRDVYQLLQLQPGVQSQLGQDLFYGSNKAGVVTVNGGRGRSNNYSVNGGDGNDLFVNIPAVQPSPDSIEEFRVITNNFDAEYGRNSGAVVNVVTKSGTNDLHGSFYEFFRNDVLNAHQFSFSQTPKTPFKQNQFGGTLGGPIRKDKTFIFGSYEGRRIINGEVSQPVPVPTAAEVKNGNFFAGGPGTEFTGALVDPTVANILQSRCGSGNSSPALNANQQGLLNDVINGTTDPGLASGTLGVPYNNPNLAPQYSLFPGNVIPTQCFDPVAVSLLQYMPGAGGSANTIFTVPENRDRGDQFQIRVDHSFNNNQKLSVYYYFDDDNALDPFARFQSSRNSLGNFPSVNATRSQQINASHTSTIGSKAVNEVRFTYFREGQMKFNTPTKTNAITASCGSGAASAFCFTGKTDTPLVDANGNCLSANPPAPPPCPANPADFGIHSGLGSKYEGVPFVFISGPGYFGNSPGGQLPQVGNTFQFADNYSRIMGNHSLKFGGDARYQKFDQFLIFDINGDFTFTSSLNTCPLGNSSGGTACPTPSSDDLGFANAFPNYLMGLSTGYLQGSPQHELVRSKSVYLFAQDSWKIKPNVTLNYGVRWEVNTPLTDAGKKVQAFRPGERSTIYPGIPGNDAAGVTPLGIVFPGDKGVPNGLTSTYYKAFAPRLGLNWSPSAHDGWLAKLTGGPGRTSVSMGYGIFYNPIEQLVLEQFSAEPPFGGSESISNSFLQAPFVGQSGTLHPNPFTGVLNPPRGTPLDWSRFLGTTYFGDFQPHMRSQYSDQYNLTIKRELPGDILVQLGYVGSQGHRLLAIYEVNETVNRKGGANTCLEINAITGASTCGQFLEDSFYQFMLQPGQSIDLPYYTPGGASATGPNVPCLPVNTPAACHYTNNGKTAVPITLSGLRFYSSPFCNPLSGAGCPSTPPIVGIFAEDTVAHSSYNSLQGMFEKRFSHGVQFQASYTWSKTLDNASSFEDALNPFNFNATYGLSKYDARHRFVFNFVWDLPVPKYSGFKGKLLDGWEVSGIESLQSGFPIRITSQADNELLDSTFNFEAPGEPNLVSAFHTQDIRKNGGQVFNPALFDNTSTSTPVPCQPGNCPVLLGTIGSSPRAICCGPGIYNTDMSFTKSTPLGERLSMEFRGDIFNIWNHAQFTSVDGNVGDTTFGQVLHVRDPRLVQFALKFKF
ncbi:MAG TPA: carboxypeptidase regulatory-like domain-containing protein [Candidatus Angelobacter sp.]|nr:carboxypeptidase regulatory-like domain-containing protein [Candidatus Angelobacter sp.]